MKGRRYMEIADVTIPEAGTHTLKICPRSISCGDMVGLKLYGAELVRK